MKLSLIHIWEFSDLIEAMPCQVDLFHLFGLIVHAKHDCQW